MNEAAEKEPKPKPRKPIDIIKDWQTFIGFSTLIIGGFIYLEVRFATFGELEDEIETRKEEIERLEKEQLEEKICRMMYLIDEKRASIEQKRADETLTLKKQELTSLEEELIPQTESIENVEEDVINYEQRVCQFAAEKQCAIDKQRNECSEGVKYSASICLKEARDACP